MDKVIDLNATLRPPRPGQGSAQEQAEAWLAYMYSGVATDVGRRQFSHWLHAAPGHAAAYRRVEQLWRDLGMLAGEPAPPAAVNRMPMVPRPRLDEYRHPARRRAAWALATAAALLLAVTAGWWQWYDLQHVRLVSGIGELRSVHLADGSRVTLSGDTHLVARLTDDARHVELRRGRAYFDVAPDAARPFEVTAGATLVRVTGTAFDVNRGPEGVQVAVVEGRVEVIDAPHTDRIGRAAVRAVDAGKKLRAGPDGALATPAEPFDAVTTLAWQAGRLHYVNTRLDTVLAEVNRYRLDKIELADPALAGYRVTASFQTNQTDQLLAGLVASYPVEIEPTRRGVRVMAR